MKVVYNNCYGGYGLSHEAIMAYARRKGLTLTHEDKGYYNLYRYGDDEYFNIDDVPRNDVDLIAAIEEVGLEKSSGNFASLVIRELPPGTLWRICEYDGNEWIETADSIDWNVA